MNIFIGHNVKAKLKIELLLNYIDDRRLHYFSEINLIQEIYFKSSRNYIKEKKRDTALKASCTSRICNIICSPSSKDQGKARMIIETNTFTHCEINKQQTENELSCSFSCVTVHAV